MPSSVKNSMYSSMDLVRSPGERTRLVSAISRREAHLQVGIVSTLESHWVVLDAELSEIRKDFGALRTVRARKAHSLDASGRQELPPETAHAPCATPCGGRQRRARTVMVAESRRPWCH